MKTLNLILSIVLIIGLMLSAGCGDSPTGPDQEKKEEIPWSAPSQELVGMWLFTEVSVNGSPSNLSSALDWEPNSAYAAIQIESDGTMYYAEFDQEFEITINGSGTVQTAGNKLKFSLTNDHGNTLNISGTWSVNGNKLTLTGKSDGKSLKLTSEKI